MQVENGAQMPQSLITCLSVTLTKNLEISGSKKQRDMLWHNAPTQLAFFYEPQGIDLLNLLYFNGYSRNDILECLKLAKARHPAACR